MSSQSPLDAKLAPIRAVILAALIDKAYWYGKRYHWERWDIDEMRDICNTPAIRAQIAAIANDETWANVDPRYLGVSLSPQRLEAMAKAIVDERVALERADEVRRERRAAKWSRVTKPIKGAWSQGQVLIVVAGICTAIMWLFATLCCVEGSEEHEVAIRAHDHHVHMLYRIQQKTHTYHTVTHAWLSHP